MFSFSLVKHWESKRTRGILLNKGLYDILSAVLLKKPHVKCMKSFAENNFGGHDLISNKIFLAILAK